MSRHAMGVLGLILVLVGLVGMAIGLVVVTVWAGSLSSAPRITLPTPAVPQPPVPVQPSVPGTDVGGFSSNGQRIFETGVGHDGAIPFTGGMGRARGMMGSRTIGCAYCHGSDGQGRRIGMMGRGSGIEAPDIRYSTLTSPTVEKGKVVPGLTDAQIASAIRTGADPSGATLNVLMPRWEMDNTDMADLLAYLKELSAR